MSEKIPYEQVMGLMRIGIDYIAGEAYQKGFEAGSHEAEKTSNEMFRLAYDKGLNDAWKCARKIAQQWEEDTTEYRVVMDDSIRVTLDSMTASEAIEKIKAYVEQQKADDEIKVGDEVMSNNAISDHTGVVLALSPGKNSAKVLENDGSMAWVDVNVLIKTGRHFNFLTPLLNEMKEGAE